MLRLFATFGIVGRFVLNLALPATGPGRRGTELKLRAAVEAKRVQIGRPSPDLETLGLTDLEGRTADLHDLRGKGVLLAFERSVDC